MQLQGSVKSLLRIVFLEYSLRLQAMNAPVPRRRSICPMPIGLKALRVSSEVLLLKVLLLLVRERLLLLRDGVFRLVLHVEVGGEYGRCNGHDYTGEDADECCYTKLEIVNWVFLFGLLLFKIGIVRTNVYSGCGS